jgi:hypothetical protein
MVYHEKKEKLNQTKHLQDKVVLHGSEVWHFKMKIIKTLLAAETDF